MPNFDGGHYFLTALIPITTDVLLERGEPDALLERGEPDALLKRGQRLVSPIQSIRKALAILPTALQTPANLKIGINSHFSYNTRTHFARLVVIEDTMYNGRDGMDALLTAATGTNPVIPQAQDRLACPYLLFVADFDAASGDLSELRSFLEELWNETKIRPMLQEVFGHCVDFASVVDGASFASYIQRGQIETTMPFNDYWQGAPPLKSKVPLLAGVAVCFLAVALAAGGWIGLCLGGWVGWLVGVLAGLVIIIIGLIFEYSLVLREGAKAFPTAPGTSLPSILKAIYLQQKFTQLAIEVQGESDDVLFAKFTDFLKVHRPTQATPTQPPGVVKLPPEIAS